MGTEPGLRSILVKFAKSRGSLTMAQIVHGRNSQSAWMVHHMTHQCNRYARMAASQDIIGWRRFMEGMISYEVVKVQQQYFNFHNARRSAEEWAKGLVVKLMEVTHGQWLVRNVQVHDAIGGNRAIRRKEDIKRAIQDQLDLGEEGLAEEDRYLLEINTDTLDTSTGETQEYWLLALYAAREAHRLGRRNEGGSAAGGGGHEERA